MKCKCNKTEMCEVCADKFFKSALNYCRHCEESCDENGECCNPKCKNSRFFLESLGERGKEFDEDGKEIESKMI